MNLRHFMFDENYEKLQKTIQTERWQDLQTLEEMTQLPVAADEINFA